MPTNSAQPTSFQVEVAELFFSLAESEGFLLAGGAALLALGLNHRMTDDLDLFAVRPVGSAADALEAACTLRGWPVRRLRDNDTFVRLEIIGDDEMRVDLCLDAPPTQPSAMSSLGPTLSPADLAGRTVLALFSRAESRDFVDVFELNQVFARSELLKLAGDQDDGFDRSVFIEMIRSHARFDDARLAVGGDDPDEIRRFFDSWATELREQ